jgi:hypothetical protein
VCRAHGGGGTKPNPEFLNIWEVGCEPIETRESVAESSYEVLEGNNAKEDRVLPVSVRDGVENNS